MAGCQLQSLVSQAVTPASITTPTSPLDAFLTAQVTPTADQTLAKKTLVLWLPPQLDPANGSLAGGILQERLAAFVQEHPQYTIEIRIKPMEGQGGLLDSLESASNVAPAALPTLIVLPYPAMDTAATGGLLLSIGGGAVDLEDPDWLPYAQTSALVNGQAYGIPFGGDALVLAYRPLESSTPPATWGELINRGGVVAFPAADPSATVISQIYLSAGGDLVDKNGKPLIEKDPLHKTLMLLNDGTRKGNFPYWLTTFSSFDESWQSFLGQQSQYAVIWSAEYLQMKPQGVSIAPVPSAGEQSVSLVKGWAWCIPSLSQTDREEGLLLLQYLSDPDFVNRWSQAAGFLPVRQSGLESWKGTLDSQLVTQLTRVNLLIPFGAPDPSTAPLLSDAMVKLVKNQAGVVQLEDAILSQFQVK
jgi:ABC-type glycerol-3-phosphate transport system substrate-binding protein